MKKATNKVPVKPRGYVECSVPKAQEAILYCEAAMHYTVWCKGHLTLQAALNVLLTVHHSIPVQ
jgi:hypothetical protein